MKTACLQPCSLRSNESQSYTDWEKTEDLFYFTAIQIYVHNLLPLWMELVRSHSRTLPILFSIIYIFMGLLHRIAIFCTIYRLNVRCCEFTSCVRLNERRGIDEFSSNLIDVYKFSCCCWCCSNFFFVMGAQFLWRSQKVHIDNDPLFRVCISIFAEQS